MRVCWRRVSARWHGQFWASVSSVLEALVHARILLMMVAAAVKAPSDTHHDTPFVTLSHVVCEPAVGWCVVCLDAVKKHGV
jgi:hypothetical protein